MIFRIETKDEEGNITFSGTANAGEASFLLNVGINYLLGQGVAPMLTGDSDEPIAEEPDQIQ